MRSRLWPSITRHLVLPGPMGEEEVFVGSGDEWEHQRSGCRVHSQPGPLALTPSHVTSGLGQARWGREYEKEKAGGKTEAVHNMHPKGPKGDICLMNRAPGTHPDFVILRLVLQILIKLLLGVEFNAIYFKLLANLEARKRSKVAKCQDKGRLVGCACAHTYNRVCVSVCAKVRRLKAAFDNRVISEL